MTPSSSRAETEAYCPRLHSINQIHLQTKIIFSIHRLIIQQSKQSLIPSASINSFQYRSIRFISLSS